MSSSLSLTLVKLGRCPRNGNFALKDPSGLASKRLNLCTEPSDIVNNVSFKVISLDSSMVEHTEKESGRRNVGK